MWNIKASLISQPWQLKLFSAHFQHLNLILSLNLLFSEREFYFHTENLINLKSTVKRRKFFIFFRKIFALPQSLNFDSHQILVDPYLLSQTITYLKSLKTYHTHSFQVASKENNFHKGSEEPRFFIKICLSYQSLRENLQIFCVIKNLNFGRVIWCKNINFFVY